MAEMQIEDEAASLTRRNYGETKSSAELFMSTVS
jgi:hypothetical protein